MYAKMKSGKILTGKAAEVFTKIGIAKECKEPAKKVVKVIDPKEVKPAKKVVKKSSKK